MMRDVRDEWQSHAVDKFLEARHDFLVTATPGAGKTKMALKAARELLDAAVIKRIIVVVPSENLKHQWAEVALNMGIDLTANYKNNDGALTAARHGTVVTYQQVAHAPSLWRRHSARDAMLIFDEIHHAGDERSWGAAIREAFEVADRRLLLSGTPFRTDGKPIPFVAYDGNGISVSHGGISYSVAVEGNIVRPVQFEVLDGDAHWIDLGQTVAVTMSSASDEEEQMRAWGVMRDPDQAWIPSVFARADAELTRQREQLPNAAGLIYAATIQHATRYAEIMTSICGQHVPVVYSEMDGDPNATIKNFAKGTQRWLVAVKMVSEGVDIPRAVVGVYASDVMTELWIRQVVGRHVRITGPDDEVIATMFIPNITRLCDIASRIEEEARVGLSEAAKERTERDVSVGELRLSFIEPLHTSEANLTEIIRQGEVMTSAEIAYAEQLRVEHGLTALHASDVAKLLRDHDRRQGDERREQTIAVVPVPTFTPVGGDAERKALGKIVNSKVAAVARTTKREHQSINAELKRVFGCSKAEADADGLRKRIAYLEGLQ